MPNPPRPISSASANPAALNSATTAEPTSRCVGKGSLSILLLSEHRSDDKPSPQGMDAQSDPGLPRGRLGAGLTERNLTSQWVGRAYAEPVAQRAVAVHAGGNLPAEITSFVGRRRELAAAKRALSKSRLV